MYPERTTHVNTGKNTQTPRRRDPSRHGIRTQNLLHARHLHHPQYRGGPLTGQVRAASPGTGTGEVTGPSGERVNRLTRRRAPIGPRRVFSSAALKACRRRSSACVPGGPQVDRRQDKHKACRCQAFHRCLGITGRGSGQHYSWQRIQRERKKRTRGACSNGNLRMCPVCLSYSYFSLLSQPNKKCENVGEVWWV